MAMLASAGELNVHLQRDVDPDQADQALTLAGGVVVAYCGWAVAQETTTLTGEGNGTMVLSLPTLRLTDVTSVTLDGVALDLSDRTLLTFTRRGQLLRSAGWRQFAQVDVNCTHGYDPLPDVIKLIVLELAARTLNNPEMLTAASVGQVSRTYATGTSPKLSPLDERLLAPFVLP